MNEISDPLPATNEIKFKEYFRLYAKIDTAKNTHMGQCYEHV